MINPYHLKYFTDAALTGSLSEAAKLNLVSQSAISQAIRSMELILGFELITHQKKIFQLTDEGYTVLELSNGIFDALLNLEEVLKNRSAEYTGVLSIGCTNSVAIGILPQVLAHLIRDYPKLKPQVRIGNSEVIKEWILGNKVEVGMMVDDGKYAPDLKRHFIKSGEYFLFSNKNSNLINSKNNSNGLVVTRRDRAEVQYYLKQKKILPFTDIQCEITSWEAIKNYILVSGGIGICPDYVLTSELKSKKLYVISSQIKNPKYDLIALQKANRKLGKNAKLFIELISQIL